MDLHLGTTTLDKNVAGCLSPPDNVVEFETLMELVHRY